MTKDGDFGKSGEDFFGLGYNLAKIIISELGFEVLINDTKN
jgi:hypothetical protein